MTTPATSDGEAPVANPDGRVTPGRTEPAAVVLLLFASAREAAGAASVDLRAASVAEVLDQARSRFGDGFAAVLAGSKVWLNGEPASGPERLADGDEIAVLPPVSGG